MDMFRIDDLLDFSNEEIFTSSSSTATIDTTQQLFPQPQNTNNNNNHPQQHFNNSPLVSSDFTDDLSVPSDDVAELEWLSRFVDDSFSDIPKDSISGTLTIRSEVSAGRGRGKRSKATTNGQMVGGGASTWTWTSTERENPVSNTSRVKREIATAIEGGSGVRRCTHCASEKTPQWRTGPLGPKTLCNACGVRFKSGRLVPEYRPAASPTFVLTQHSNSHRKVMELRRQKEMLRQQQQHHRNFEVC